MKGWLFAGAFESDGRLEWLASQWQWGAALGLGLVCVILAYLGLARRRRWLEVALLGVGMIGVVVAAAQPTWIVEGRRQEAPRSAVLVDVSRSMQVLEEGAPRSLDVAKAFFYTT